MAEPIIKVENLGKLYRLGEIGTGTLSHDLNRWWHRVRGKDDPYQLVGQSNDRTTKAKSDYVWALQDVNFEVNPGEVVGIIGRNGAGKSTLLKLLSKVTSPSTGRILVDGRIASLLEVGTGFHPELTGRENIFLNGAILGMSKQEIRKKFDEIVDFAGVERYIDTPVKRYSSGMYVRLAFAVAAFLEPEILIVDEVLAVGDAEFQKKCLGRMRDVSVNDGRTVLFVSHNMAAVEALCTKGILMQNGTISLIDTVQSTIQQYVAQNSTASRNALSSRKDRIGNGAIRFTNISLTGSDGLEKETFMQGENLHIELEYQIEKPDLSLTGVHFSINLVDDLGNMIFYHTNKLVGTNFSDNEIKENDSLRFTWKCINVRQGFYTLNVDVVLFNEFIDRVENVTGIDVIEGNIYNYVNPMVGGLIAIDGEWEMG